MAHKYNHIIKELRSMLPRRPIDMPEARAVAEAQAVALLKLLGGTGPPVDIGPLTELPRVRVEVVSELHDRRLSGESGWHAGRWIIRVSKRDSLTRRRFTLAHEFKHILDGPYEKLVYAKLGLGDEQDRRACIEEIADYFAASLLMPRLFVIRALRADARDLHQLAALFMVSPVAMNRRLHALGLRIQQPEEGRDPVLRFFRKAVIYVPRQLRLAEKRDDEENDATAIAGQPPVGGLRQAGAEADEPCRSALSLLTIPEASAKLRISRWSVYQLIHSGRLETIRIGARRLVPCSSIRAFIDQQLIEEKL